MYKSNLPNVLAQMARARDAGLVAAGEVVRTEVKKGLRGGYTSGAFVTGNVWNSVRRTDPMDTEQGRGVAVFSEVNYALFWEVGHQNLFTGKYERVEVWHPALLNTAPEQLAAFNRVFARFMGEAI